MSIIGGGGDTDSKLSLGVKPMPPARQFNPEDGYTYMIPRAICIGMPTEFMNAFMAGIAQEVIGHMEAEGALPKGALQRYQDSLESNKAPAEQETA